MKFLILCSKPPVPANDGGTLASKALLDGLLNTGHSVEVLAIGTEKHPLPTDLRSIEKYGLEGLPLQTFPNKYKAFKAVVTGENYHVSRFYSKRFTELIEKKMSITSYDALILDGLNTMVYLKKIRAMYKRKVYYRAHNIESHLWETRLKETENPIEKYFTKRLVNRLKAFEKRVIHEVDGLIPISRIDLDWFKQEGVEASFLLPFAFNFKNRQLKKEDVPSKPFSVGFLGALDWEPNIQGVKWFIECVWPIVQRDLPQCQLTIAGRNAVSYFTTLQGENIAFIGEVEDAMQFMLSQKVLINPLFSGSGMRVKQAEAMSLACAVVSTVKGAEGIDMGENKSLVSDDPQKFAEIIVQLLQNEELHQRVTQENRKLAENQFDLEKNTQSLVRWMQE